MSTPHEPPPDAREPTRHYDQVIGAWAYLLGEDLHYGYFENAADSLTAATDALTNVMLQAARPGHRRVSAARPGMDAR